MKKKFLGQAERKLISNDLFWNYCYYDGNNFYHIKWTGYNDGFWWTQVCTQKDYNRKKIDGKVFELNFENCNVYEIVEE